MDDRDGSIQDIKLLQPIRSIFFHQVTPKQEQPKNIKQYVTALGFIFLYY